MSGLEAVLAAHEVTFGTGDDYVEVNGAICECGEWSNYRYRGLDPLLDAHRAHVAAVVREWLRAELAADGMREYVCDATEEALNVLGWNYGTSEEVAPEAAAAALDAIAAQLTGEKR